VGWQGGGGGGPNTEGSARTQDLKAKHNTGKLVTNCGLGGGKGGGWRRDVKEKIGKGSKGTIRGSRAGRVKSGGEEPIQMGGKKKRRDRPEEKKQSEPPLVFCKKKKGKRKKEKSGLWGNKDGLETRGKR